MRSLVYLKHKSDNINCSGIYKITNIKDNKIYIGSAGNTVRERFYRHSLLLQTNKHYNIHLQRAYNKYGKENFEFETLATCPSEYCIKLEQWFLDNLKPEYNILRKAGNNEGHSPSIETRLKISNTLKGRKLPTFSQEHKENMSNAFKGRKLTKETKEKISLSHKGKTGRLHSKESRDKIASAHKGLKVIKKTDLNVIDLETGIFYDNAKECAKTFNIKYSTFKGHVNGRVKSCSPIKNRFRII